MNTASRLDRAGLAGAGAVKAFITTRNGGVSTGPHASFNLGLRADDDPQRSHETAPLLRRFCRKHPNGCGKCTARAWSTPMP